ncbi:MAG TPA: DUF58 domain-containing protein, partial [Polyangiaceae bacterium]|nr:DUF58 domain-containing protein [Polyangiaceae bacterium]
MPIVPSRSLLWLASVPLLATVLALLDGRFQQLAFAVDLGIAALAALDALLARSGRIHVVRRAPDVMSLQRRNEVELTVRSSARRKLIVTIQDDLFDGAVASDLPLTLELGPFASRQARYYVEPSQRGAFALGDHHVRHPSPLGLWLRQLRVQSRAPLKVYPDLRQIQLFDELARESRELEWVRSSKRSGGEVEFSRLRDYVPGDEYRAVDWKATARRQKLTTREYQLESNQNILFMLDAGRMMTGMDGGISRFDHALNATLMLAHVAA